MSSIKFDLLPNEFLIFIEHYNNLSYLSSIPSVFYVVLCFYSYILVYYFKNGKKKQEICRFRFLTEDLIQEPQMNIKKCCDINIDMIPSYIIKKKLSFFVILTLFLQILCEYFSFSNRKVFNFFYVEVGKVLVWILSILLLRLNMINRKKPKFYTNGLFWLLSFCFDILLCVSLKVFYFFYIY